MPNLGGTGPSGKGPLTGRVLGRRQVSSGDCVCPKCGHTEAHVRGKPCTQTKCPKCKTAMKGVFCR